MLKSHTCHVLADRRRLLVMRPAQYWRASDTNRALVKQALPLKTSPASACEEKGVKRQTSKGVKRQTSPASACEEERDRSCSEKNITNKHREQVKAGTRVGSERDRDSSSRYGRESIHYRNGRRKGNMEEIMEMRLHVVGLDGSMRPWDLFIGFE